MHKKHYFEIRTYAMTPTMGIYLNEPPLEEMPEIDSPEIKFPSLKYLQECMDELEDDLKCMLKPALEFHADIIKIVKAMNNARSEHNASIERRSKAEAHIAALEQDVGLIESLSTQGDPTVPTFNPMLQMDLNDARHELKKAEKSITRWKQIYNKEADMHNLTSYRERVLKARIVIRVQPKMGEICWGDSELPKREPGAYF